MLELGRSKSSDQDRHAVENIELVFSNGVLHDPAKLLDAMKELFRFAAHENALPR